VNNLSFWAEITILKNSLVSEADDYVKRLYESKQLDPDIAQGLGFRRVNGARDALRRPDIGLTSAEARDIAEGIGSPDTAGRNGAIAGIGESTQRAQAGEGQNLRPAEGLGGSELGGGLLKQGQLFHPPSAAKERGFIKTARESEATAPAIAEKIQGLYDPLSNKETLERAISFAKENPDEAMRIMFC